MITPILKYNCPNIEFYRTPDIFNPGPNLFTHWENILGTNDDMEAIILFLNKHSSSHNTFKKYCNEIERLLLWLEYKKFNLTDLSKEDIVEYYDFLRSPLPIEYWVGPSLHKFLPNRKCNPQWKPFKKQKMNHNSAILSIRAISSMFKYFQQNYYVKYNPVELSLFENRSKCNIENNYNHNFLRPELIEFILKFLELKANIKVSEKEKFENCRKFLIFYILSQFGLKISELSKMKNCQMIRSINNHVIHIEETNKRIIPISSDQYHKIKKYISYLKSPSSTVINSEYIFTKYNSFKSLSTAQIMNIIKTVFLDISQAIINHEALFKENSLDEIFYQDIENCYTASAKWLRHTYATTYLMKSNSSAPDLLNRLGISSSVLLASYKQAVDNYKNNISPVKSKAIENIYNKIILNELDKIECNKHLASDTIN